MTTESTRLEKKADEKKSDRVTEHALLKVNRMWTLLESG
jgi:hypothetical protein